MKTTSKKMGKNEDDLKKIKMKMALKNIEEDLKKNEDDLKNKKNEDDLKKNKKNKTTSKKSSTLIGCDIIVN